jgi:N6-L-threonylcarbamoyladenine synthase
MLVLGIETSCDETAVSVVENGKRILSNVVASSLHLHKEYGGVVPELATRHHVELINYVLDRALRQAKVGLEDIGLVACVYGPGLVGALLIGMSLAKALSLSLNVPLIGINHLQAHIYAALMNKKRIQFPFAGMVVSGGHTHLFYVKNFLNWQLIGRTRDDAAGEAYDKVAKILNLGYPGGPVIERMAAAAGADKIRFPRSWLEKDSLDFSFSGLKTAVLYYVKSLMGDGSQPNVHAVEGTRPPLKQLQNISAGFQEAVVDVLADRAVKACLLKKVKWFVVGGGVIQNRRLREVLSESLKWQGIGVSLPEVKLCQDNAAMVAGLGYQLYRRGIVSDLNLEVAPNLV